MEVKTEKPVINGLFTMMEGYNTGPEILEDLNKKTRLKLVTLTGCLGYSLTKNGIDPSRVSIQVTTQNMIYEYKEGHGGEHVLNSEYFLLTRNGPDYLLLIEIDALEGGVPGMVLGWIFIKAGLRIVEEEKEGRLFIFPNPVLELDYLQSLMDEYELGTNRLLKRDRKSFSHFNLKKNLGGL